MELEDDDDGEEQFYSIETHMKVIDVTSFLKIHCQAPFVEDAIVSEHNSKITVSTL